MSKNAKDGDLPPEVAALHETLARFTRQADRGTALIASAWVDDCLKACVRAFFRPDKKIADDVLQPEGALGTFASRIKLAYLLDIIDPTAYRDLDLLRRIRNEFAHRRSDLRFTSPPIKDRCREFHAIKACKLGGWPLSSPKHQVLVTSFFLSQYLIDLAKPRKRNPLLDHSDAYRSWIRRTVKSRSIALAAEVAGVA